MSDTDASPPGLFTDPSGVLRCAWCRATPAYQRYHDEEWGFPEGDEHRLFEKLCLEGFQAGLSWLTILNKREAFRHAFAGFDIEKVARFGEADIQRLLADAGIVRHRGKITATINNAQRAIELRREFGSLAAYLWRFEPEAGVRAIASGPSSQAVALSKDLKKRGWRFVGPTTVHAFMQAMGLVNDHLEGCGMREVIRTARADFRKI
jgi:DNA-3-methyladenine glycosylase I